MKRIKNLLLYAALLVSLDARVAYGRSTITIADAATAVSSPTIPDHSFEQVLFYQQKGQVQALLTNDASTTNNQWALSLGYAIPTATGVKMNLLPLAPASGVSGNGAVGGASPFHAAQITHVALCNGLPVATVGTDLYLLQDLTGTSVLKNDPVLRDVAGADIDNAIAAVAASADTIFAAVPAIGTTFGDEAGVNRGIALVRVSADKTKLVQLDPADIAAGTNLNAIKLDVAVGGPVATDESAGVAPITSAKIGNDVVMHWDDNVKRLYIGLSEVKRNATASEGGVLGIVMGQFDAAGDVFTLEPFAPQTKAAFYDATDTTKKNLIDRIIGFYADGTAVLGVGNTARGDKEISLTVKHIKSMQTVPGKNYLIVVSTIQGRDTGDTVDQRKSGIFYLPLTADGRLAKADFSGAADALSNMPTYDANCIDISFAADDIESVTVQGQSVLISCASADKQGLFQSIAIVDEVGVIKGWTPFVRVGGAVVETYGGMFDNHTGNYVCVQDNNAGDARRVLASSQWGTGVTGATTVADDSLASLVTLINKHFGPEQGGVRGIYSFDGSTEGIHRDFAMLVILGYDKVMVAETMKGGVSTTAYTDAAGTPNVKIYTSPALTAIAPLTTATVSVEDLGSGTNTGTIKVGGYKGMCKFLAVAGGDAGWNAAGLADIADIATFVFNDNTTVPAEARALLYKNVNNNLTVYPNRYVGRIVAQALDKPLTDAYAFDGLLVQADAITPTNSLALVATSTGINVHRVAGTTIRDHFVALPNNEAALALQYVNKGTTGILYVLAGDLAADQGKLYRYAVDATAADRANILNPVDAQPQLIDLGAFRRFMMADGLEFLTSRDGALYDADLLNLYSHVDRESVSLITSYLQNVDGLSEMGAPVRERVTGALLVPGLFGVRINQ